MYGLTRATLTLIGVAVAGVAAVARDRDPPECGLRRVPRGVLDGVRPRGRRRPRDGAVAAPRWLDEVGLAARFGERVPAGFLPTLIAGGWILAAHEPESNWLGSHVRSWSGDIGIDGFVDSMGLMIPAVAFGIGLVLRAHVRHDRPATRPDEAGARSGCAATGIGDTGTGAVRTGACVSRTPSGSPIRPSARATARRIRQVRIVRGRVAAAALTPGRDRSAVGRRRYSEHERRRAAAPAPRGSSSSTARGSRTSSRRPRCVCVRRSGRSSRSCS